MGEEKDIAMLEDRMRRLCSRREYCRSDIFRKVLTALDGDRDAAEKIVAGLVEERYVDDARYAEAFARDKSSLAGWGAVKIRYMLSMKGVAKDVIDAALDSIDSDKSASRLEKLMAARFRSLEGDPQCRLKLLRFGMGRGYLYEEVENVVNRLMKKR